jgi:hypothetical protein
MKTHGMRDHPLYKTWCEMRYRCENPNKHNFRYYGGRGISVCVRWQDFEAFAEDMGVRPEGMTLDRIDPNGNYEPENCRWATKKQQMNNRGNYNRILTVKGRRVTMTQASRLWRVPVGTIWMRLKLGWGEEDAAIRSVRKHKPYQANLRAEGKAYG